MVMVVLVIQWAPVPLQNNLSASAVLSRCDIEMGSKRGWLTGKCKGDTDQYCSISGDCERIIEILEE